MKKRLILNSAWSSFLSSKVATKTFVYGVVPFFLGAMIVLQPQDAASSPSQQKILKLEAVLQLPANPSSAAWAPDGRKLLVNVPYTLVGKKNGPIIGSDVVVIADIEKKNIGKIVPKVGIGKDDFFWSPSGKFIVVVSATKIRLFSYPGFEAVAELRASVGKRHDSCYFRDRTGAEFTSDSQFLWVACSIPTELTKNRANYLAAIKIAIPEMKIADRLMVPHPEPGKKLHPRHYISFQEGQAVLYSHLKIYRKIDDELEIIDYFACYLLLSNTKCFQTFNIENLGLDIKHFGIGIKINGVRGNLYPPIYSITYGNIIAPFSIFNSYDSALRKTYWSHNLAVVDAKYRRIVAKYSQNKALRNKRIARLILSGNGELLLGFSSSGGKVNATPARHQTLRVWRSKDLQLLQTIKSVEPSWVRLSPDSTHLAILSGNQAYIYSVAKYTGSSGD